MKPGATRTDYLLFSLVYFVEGALGLAGVAIPLFMREELGLSVSSVAALSGLVALPWILKPLYGVLSDYAPLWGYRRKPYLIIGSLLSFFGWLMTAINALTIPLFVLWQIIADLGIASLDVFTDGLAVQKSNNQNRGFIQSLCWASRSTGAVVAGVIGGWLVTVIGYRGVFGLTALLPLIVLVCSILVKEERSKAKRKRFIAQLSDLGRTYLHAKELHIVSLFLFLWFATPSFGTPLFFHLREDLGFSETHLGLLSTIGAIGSLIGSILYGRFFSQLRLRTILTWLVWISFVTPFSFLFITTLPIALVVYLFNSVIGIIALVACMNLSAKACPSGGEASTFSILTGITNLGSAVIGPALGGLLFSLVGYTPLVIVAAVSNVFALMVVKRLPS